MLHADTLTVEHHDGRILQFTNVTYRRNRDGLRVVLADDSEQHVDAWDIRTSHTRTDNTGGVR
jgi:hypothetical protein